MAKRTMGVTCIWFHPRRKPNEICNVAECPDGSDLLDLIDYFAREITPDSLVSRVNESYALLENRQRAGRSMLLEFASGRFGEEGQIRDISTHIEVGEFKRNNATAVTTHGVVLVPRSGSHALVFSERSADHGGMPGFIDEFIEAFNTRFPQYLMKKQSVVRTDAWLNAAQLTKVVGTVRKHRTDVASDPGDEVIGELTHTFMPPKGQKYLSRRLWELLRDRKINEAKFLGFEEGRVLDEVEVTLSDGTQSKTFELGRERTPNLNLVLSARGDAAPSGQKVLGTALDEAPEIFKNYGIEWSQADAVERRSP